MFFASLAGGQDAARQEEKTEMTYDSFVNARYTQYPPLTGWLTTEKVVRETLREWYPGLKVGRTLEDGTPGSFAQFLKDMSGVCGAQGGILYLASYQSPQGGWEFVDGQRGRWSDWLGNLSEGIVSNRAVLVDCCYAASLGGLPGWGEKLAPLSLFACNGREVTYEIPLTRRMPVDFPRRYPRASAWLDQHVSKDEARQISFLGLAWLVAYVERSQPPRTRDEWMGFFKSCEEKAEEFRKKHGRRWASQVQGWSADLSK